MARFSIDTDKVENVADDISSLTSKSSGLTSNVSGYDTSNDDGFNFSSAKDSIVHNLEGVETKINNTVKMLEVIAGTHEGLQNSVDENGDTSGTTPTTNYTGGSVGSYYSSSGGGYGGGSSYSSSSYSNAIATPIGGENNGSGLPEDNLVTSFEPIPLGLDQMSLSAVELLNQVLSSTSASTSLAANSLLENKLSEEKIADGIKDTETKVANEIKPDELESASNNKTIIVLEKNSSDDAAYQTLIAEVANEYKIDFKVLLLDSIIQDKDKTDGLDIKLSSVIEESSLKVNDPSNGEHEEEKSSEGTESKEEELEEKSTEKEEESLSKTEDNQEENISGETETKEEPQEEKASEGAETKEEKKEESINKTNTTSENSKYTVLDQGKYNTLTSLKTAGTAKNNLEETPVTLIIRNGVIISAINGVTTKEKLESIIAGTGITKENTIM